MLGSYQEGASCRNTWRGDLEQTVAGWLHRIPVRNVSSSSDGDIADQSGRTPDVGVVLLVPIDKGLPQGDARDSGPTATETNIVLAVEEVGGVARVQVHGFESIVGRQRRAGPFPKTSSVALSAEAIAMGRDGRRMPVAEGDITITELDEELLGVWGRI